MTPDQINGTFEFVGGTLVWLSIFKLLRDKEVKGASIIPILFFNTWGWWNIIYYPGLEQWWSLWGAIWLSISTTIQTGLMYYFNRKNRRAALLDKAQHREA